FKTFCRPVTGRPPAGRATTNPRGRRRACGSERRMLVRKTLLATTALAAATGLAAVASPAGAAERLSVSIGGYFQAYYGFWDVDPTDTGPAAAPTGENSYRSHDFFREAEIHFKGEVALDNGMKVGLDVQLEAETCG